MNNEGIECKFHNNMIFLSTLSLAQFSKTELTTYSKR